MAITAAQVKELREKTGLGMMDCKKALNETNGDMEKAIESLRKSGEIKAAKKGDRATGEGIVISYIHSNSKMGVLLELSCETDFVAGNADFQTIGRDIAMHIAAMNPPYLRREDVPEDVVAKEREIAAETVKGKPAEIIDKIVDGKMNKFYAEQCLEEQKYIKDDSMTITDVVKAAIQKVGENVKLARFTRYEVGA